ncbi:hypothetical protein AVEN_3799-1 [Araneus ventricosus]|uniref:Uncharacterized protein n=1 Tax=Araneus ventricosus TaxID=182803 RepID=A0A4Y2HE11_ARAVE|nr:hypothetical protein AVEN_3799-1 [Araneus ventricosus]
MENQRTSSLQRLLRSTYRKILLPVDPFPSHSLLDLPIWHLAISGCGGLLKSKMYLDKPPTLKDAILQNVSAIQQEMLLNAVSDSTVVSDGQRIEQI